MATVTFKDNYVINDVICDLMSLNSFMMTSKFNGFGNGQNFFAQFIGVDK